MTRVLRLLGVSAALAAGLCLAVPQAGAATAAIREVDAARFPEVRLSVRVDGPRPSLSSFRVTENGKRVPSSQVRVRPLADSGRPVGTVLVIDVSGSMLSGGALEQAKAAAKQFVATRLPTESIAVVSFASQVQVLSDFTQDTAGLDRVIDGLAARGETALWDALARGGDLLAKSPQLQPNLVLLSDGGDTVSSLDLQAARAAISSANATVMAIGLRTNEFDPASLREVVDTSGLLVESADPEALADAFGQVRGALESQYEISYASASSPGVLLITVETGTLRAEASARAGSSGSAGKATIHSSGKVSDSPLWRIFVVALVFAAVLSVGVAVLMLVTRDRERIGRRLAMYGGSVEEHQSRDGALLQSGVLARGVDLAEQRLGRGTLLKGLDGLLDRAYLPLRPAEALVAYALCVLVLGLLALVLAPSAFLASLLTIAGAIVPVAVLQFRVGQQANAFEGQLPDTLQLLSASLRAGYSLLQGVEALGEQTVNPMQREIRKVLAESRLGRPIEEALGDVAERMRSKDFHWAVVAIRIQREVGGNLAEVLNTVAETMVERDRLRREVRALTAEGRISAIVMGLLPFGLALMLMAASPGYLDPLVETATGKLMVAGAGVLGVFGALWLRKIVKVEF